MRTHRQVEATREIARPGRLRRWLGLDSLRVSPRSTPSDGTTKTVHWKDVKHTSPKVTMYTSPVGPRPSREDEDRLRREPRIDTNVPGTLNPYSNPSPTMAQYHPYSPPNPPLQQQQPAYSNYTSSRPSSSAAHQMLPTNNQGPPARQPTSPADVRGSAYPPREAVKSTYYDPTSEHRDGASSWSRQSPYTGRSPQVRNIRACSCQGS